MKRAEIVSRKPVLKASLFEVDEVKVKYSSGEEKTHHLAIRRPTVSVIPFLDNSTIFLVSQYRYMLERVTLEVMAGFIDENEESIDAAKRELEEETGLKAGSWQRLAQIEMAGSVFRATNNIFLASSLEKGKINPDDDEDIKVVEMSLDEALGKVENGEINHSSSIIAILLVDRLRREGRLKI